MGSPTFYKNRGDISSSGDIGYGDSCLREGAPSLGRDFCYVAVTGSEGKSTHHNTTIKKQLKKKKDKR